MVQREPSKLSHRLGRLKRKYHPKVTRLMERYPLWSQAAIGLAVYILIEGVYALLDVLGNNPGMVKIGQTTLQSSRIVSTAVSIGFSLLISRVHIRQDVLIRGENAIELGLFYSSMNADGKACMESVEMMRDASQKSHDLHIAGATGWNTFGDRDSPLYDAVLNCRNRLEIILAYPWSDGVKERVHGLTRHPSKYNKELRRYRTEIIDTVAMLVKADLEAADIKVKMYKYAPFWKANIFDKQAWVQNYPAKKHVNEAACFAYEKKTGGIYEEHSQRFTLLMKSPMLYEVNLEDGTIDFGEGPIAVADKPPGYDPHY